MIHESCFWLWLFYNNICFRLHTRIAEEIYWNWNYLRESGKKCFNLLFVEAIKNFLNETKKNQNLPCLSFHPNLIALSQLMNSANVFYSFFLFFFLFCCKSISEEKGVFVWIISFAREQPKWPWFYCVLRTFMNHKERNTKNILKTISLAYHLKQRMLMPRRLQQKVISLRK